jgi:O-antigen ligase
MLLTVDSVVQYFRGVDFLRGYRWDRLTASFSTATDFAGWLIVIIPLFFGLLLAGKPVSRGLKALLIVLTVLLSVCLLLTYARGAWLGFIMVIVLMIGYIFRNFDLRIKLLCLFVGVGVLAVFLVLPQSLRVKATSVGRIDFKTGQTVNARIKSIAKLGEGSILIRSNLWKEALRIIRDYNFTGCGLNTYSIVARGYKSFNGGGIYPHNSYLQMAAETGLFGLFAFLWVLFTFFKIGLRYLHQKNNFLVLGLLSGILAFLVQAFFDTHLYALKLVVLFWYTLGLTMAVIKLEQKEII